MAGTDKTGGRGVKLRTLYERMVVMRLFEERVDEVFTEGLVSGTAHVCAGQEAVAVGACDGVRKSDYVTSTHRGHGHFLAKGGDPNRIMAELFGKSDGYSGGRGGSQLMADFKLGFLGANGITGGGLPIATGVGLSVKLRKTNQVVLCFFGDGAANQGTFHESLNMASIWGLPVIFLCENNGYAMSASFKDTSGSETIAARAAAYGMPGVSVDGNDVLAVRDVVRAAAKHARSGNGPTLIECVTYRLLGHSRGDPRCYRTRREEQQWRKKDPIAAFGLRLEEEGLLSKAERQAVARRAAKVVAGAVAFARRSPCPDTATVTDGLFAEERKRS
jgi:TPP-dependent pyruvate/acetoin dehydrogenase alpha subunit